MRVLAIDADEAVRQMCAALGPDVLVDHDSGRGAIERIRRGDPIDLVLIDLTRTEHQGIVVYAFAHSQAAPIAQRIAFLTGARMSETTTALLGSISNARFAKPVTRDEIGSVARALGRRLPVPT